MDLSSVRIREHFGLVAKIHIQTNFHSWLVPQKTVLALEKTIMSFWTTPYLVKPVKY